MRDILIVDDEVEIRILLKRILEMDGHLCEIAGDGIEAYERIESNPDLKIVISDIRMPNMSGVELIKKVNELIPNPPKFIFISGFSQYSEKELIDMGALKFMKKPDDIDEISEYVKTVLSK